MCQNSICGMDARGTNPLIQMCEKARTLASAPARQCACTSGALATRWSASCAFFASVAWLSRVAITAMPIEPPSSRVRLNRPVPFAMSARCELGERDGVERDEQHAQHHAAHDDQTDPVRGETVQALEEDRRDEDLSEPGKPEDGAHQYAGGQLAGMPPTAWARRMTSAMMYPTLTQEIWSNVASRFPIMCL